MSDAIKKTISVYPCFKGEVIAVKDTKSEMFDNLGKGVAIIPSDGTIYSPVNGRITSVFPTKHIIGFAVEPGIDMLIHMGVDTACLKGKPYKIEVKAGREVKVGDVLGKMDLEYLAAQEKNPVTPILVTNEEECEVEILQESGEADLSKPLYQVSREVEE